MTTFWEDWDWQAEEPFLYGAVATAAYPPLTPSGRSYSMGRFAVSREVGFGGGQVKFLHSDRVSGLTMELNYENLTQAEMASIRDHYRGQQGSFVSFLLPAEVWAGQSNVANIVPAGMRWKYQGPPEETQKRGGYVDTSVALVTDGTWLPSIEPLAGFDLGINAIWSPGVATQTSPLSLTVVVSWTAGAATGGTDEDDGFAASLFWSEDLYASWR
jgi:hypothetical protein